MVSHRDLVWNVVTHGCFVIVYTVGMWALFRIPCSGLCGQVDGPSKLPVQSVHFGIHCYQEVTCLYRDKSPFRTLSGQAGHTFIRSVSVPGQELYIHYQVRTPRYTRTGILCYSLLGRALYTIRSGQLPGQLLIKSGHNYNYAYTLLYQVIQ